MNFTRAIFRYSVFFLALFPLFAIWGFWVTYLTRPPETVSGYEHLHGLAMFSWCLMLVFQSLLIRTNRGYIHRHLGKLSYLLAPLIVVSTLLLANYRLNVRGLTAEGVYLLGLQVFTLILYTVCYAMAIRHRKRRDVHARWMVCTALSLFDPIFARIIAVNFVHVPFETGIIQYITYSCIDLIVIVLIFLDWKSHQRRDVFVPVLILLFATQLPIFFFIQTPAWEAFAAWFMALPLS